MIFKKIILLFVFFAAFVQTGTAAAFEIAALNSPVIDEVGILNPSIKRQLEESLYNFRKNNQVQLQVYIIKSLQGLEIESAAIQIFDKWQLGDEKTDKGLLFLVAPNEKRMRIEVGQGLEGDVPDVIAKRIISDVVRPYFQRGEYAMGIAQGVSTLQNYIVNPTDAAQAVKNADAAPSKKGGHWIIFIIIGIWILIFIFNPSLALYILFSAMSGGRGGGGGGGSWSGGGGRSSGGGASGGW